MKIIGIDPGPLKSAICVWDGKAPSNPGKYDNEFIYPILSGLYRGDPSMILAVEKPVCQRHSGSSVSETAIIAGVMIGKWSGEHRLITRSKIRWRIGKVKKTNDSLIRKKLIDGIYPEYNLHTNPGPLVGIVEDTWQALAVAVTCFDLIKKGEI